MASAVYSTRQPTASQFASATVHLERRGEWVYFWREGVRYVRIISGRSNRLYVLRADSAGCSCAWSTNPWSGGTPCSHRIALELDALEEDLAEARDLEQPAPTPAAPTKTIEDLWPTCRVVACDDDPEPREDFCWRHMLVDAF